MTQEYPDLSYPDKFPEATRDILYKGKNGEDHRTLEGLKASILANKTDQLRDKTRFQVEQI